MELPKGINRVKIVPEGQRQIFPPYGFLMIEEGNGGAGDYYGLYWQIGRENEDPIVCEMLHEEFLLKPVFPDLDSFISWFEETEGQEAPSINLNDKKFFINLYNRGKVFTRKKMHTEAIQLLEVSVELFSEYSDSWALLAENYFQLGNIKMAEIASLNSIISNYLFGFPSKKAIDLFNILGNHGEMVNNPLFKRKSNLIDGGDFKNPFTINYKNLREAINEFKELNDSRSAAILEQNYGMLMQMEKNEIKKNNEFNADMWVENYGNELEKNFPARV